ncbi:MAG: hypothetical protein IJM18_07795 [Clostridia bacterium]|nr:hypothetical protein [Clostridia bacterium]
MNRRKRKALLKMAVDGSNDYMDKLVITVRFHQVFVSDLLPLNFYDYFYEYYECSAQFEKAEAFFYHIVWEVFNEYGFICWNAGDSLHESIMDAEFKYRFKKPASVCDDRGEDVYDESLCAKQYKRTRAKVHHRRQNAGKNIRRSGRIDKAMAEWRKSENGKV